MDRRGDGVRRRAGPCDPRLNEWLDKVKIGTVSLPIAIGLLVMMYPVLAKVRYKRIGEAFADRRAMGMAMLFNWVVGPIVMFSTGVADASGSPRVPHRADHRRACPVHRDGADLERSRRR